VILAYTVEIFRNFLQPKLFGDIWNYVLNAFFWSRSGKIFENLLPKRCDTGENLGVFWKSRKRLDFFAPCSGKFWEFCLKQARYLGLQRIFFFFLELKFEEVRFLGRAAGNF